MPVEEANGCILGPATEHEHRDVFAQVVDIKLGVDIGLSHGLKGRLGVARPHQIVEAAVVQKTGRIIIADQRDRRSLGVERIASSIRPEEIGNQLPGRIAP